MPPAEVPEMMSITTRVRKPSCAALRRRALKYAYSVLSGEYGFSSPESTKCAEARASFSSSFVIPCM